MNKINKKFLLLATLLFITATSLNGAVLNKDSLNISALKNVEADSWSVVGENMVIKGNVHIPYNDIEIFADEAIINSKNKDIEAVGNVRLLRWNKGKDIVKAEKLSEIESLPNTKIKVTSLRGNQWGDLSVNVDTLSLGDNVSATKIAGNLESGYFQFENIKLRMNSYICRGKNAERLPDGIIKIKNAELSSCEYLEGNNAHYSISCSEVTLTPPESMSYGVDNINSSTSDYTAFLTNGFLNVYGVPVIWLPVFYKPRNEVFNLADITVGSDSDWGFFALFSRKFVFSEYPYASATLKLDFYADRGVGYGTDINIETENSKTQGLFYSIYDRDPYGTDHYDDYRLDVPENRYIFNLSNVTHITPRLDFRGTITIASDYYFSRDFFTNLYDANMQPATYAALEQQFDHFSASIYVRPKINSFYTTVQRLPEIRFDVPRQEIFDTNLYYQGDLSLDYLRMDWIDFDKNQNVFREFAKLQNYDSFRFDTTHFLYYPIRLDWLTVVPRAGLKMTAYSKSSEEAVDEGDLFAMFAAANPQSKGVFSLPSYDDDGGGKFRFIGEIGVEASTKIHNSWQNVRNAWLGIDGLRHIMRPYLNYTYIPDPTVDRKYLYYFDDIDRITEQHFIRFGIDNRLQTRDGKMLKDYFVMENYWDLHFNKENSYNQIGNIGTKITTKPFDGFSLSSEFLIDVGDNNEDIEDVYRQGRNVGNKGLNLKWLNRWNIEMQYTPVEDLNFKLAYTYNRNYGNRSAYSMGSTLTQMDAGGLFNNYFDEHTDELSFTTTFPITPDRRTFGSYTMSYDFLQGYSIGHAFRVVRQFHCWTASVGVEVDTDYNSKNKKIYETSFDFSLNLTGLSPNTMDENPVLKALNKGIENNNHTSL